MRFQHILEKVYYSPWFITPEAYQSICKIVESKLAEISVASEDSGMLEALIRQREKPYIDGDGIAHISILGVLGNKMSQIEETCGNTDYQRVASEIQGVLEEKCKAIMFDIDSPGGTVAGNAELVDMIQGINVPTMAFSDSRMCSAAYNIASSCKYIFATKSAMIGSIGCIIPWIDKSQMWHDAGMKFDPITNKEADLKAAMQGPSLSEPQREYLQSFVDEAFSQFKSNVLRNRSVPSSAMRGQAFMGNMALKNNLIDGICGKDQARNKLLQIL